MKVFISGPYQYPDPVINTRNAILAGEEVIKRGHIPFIPHLNHLWHTVSPHPINYWMEYDLEWMKSCDVVWRLPGYSNGGDKEVWFAKDRGMRVIYDINEL